jgi:predicted ferric reductase
VSAPAAQGLRRALAPALLLAATVLPVAWAWPHGVAPWRATGIVSAWVGCGALVASLVLMVREPRWAAAFGGLEHLYRWHHRCGVIGYLTLLLHPLALAWQVRSESPAVAWAVLAPWPNDGAVQVGWLALLLLVAGMASTFAMRLRYRAWRGWHVALGAAVVLALLHVALLLGNDALLLVLAAAAAAALAWRIVHSDLGVAAKPYRVARVQHLTPQMIETLLEPLAGTMALRPGQFVLAAFGDGPHYAGCAEFHPFTVSAIVPDGALALAIKALGPCTQQLQRLQPDTLVRLQGPFGDFLADTARAPQLWIAGGVGITPFIARLRQGPLPQQTHLVYALRRREDAAFIDELEIHARNDLRFTLRLHIDAAPVPDAAAWLEPLADLREREVQLCGPPPLVTYVKAELARRGVSAAQIHSESFDFR